jgi:hypothetical protein
MDWIYKPITELKPSELFLAVAIMVGILHLPFDIMTIIKLIGSLIRITRE